MRTEEGGDDAEEDLNPDRLLREKEWWNKAEFIRFLTGLAKGYPPRSQPRQFIEEYIEDLRKNG